ncbi:HAD-IB family phosphatase [Candidatus Kaiserbacteria bacterium]|nr:HAD-IB family phosphatase [Candidatus Kaiserbacteria bacterium]
MAIVFFDFDSTIVSYETLDHALAHVLRDHPDKKRMIAEIEDITRLGMEGKADFREGVRRRVAVVPLTKSVLEETGEAMLSEITPGMRHVFEWLRERGHELFIVSGGFRECVVPVAQSLGVADDHVFTNQFLFSQDGAMCGFDETSLLWTSEGKTPILKAIRGKYPKETIIMIGDGANDLKAYESGAADHFIGFGGHVVRDIVKAKAPSFAYSTKELLSHLEKFFVQ